MNERCILLVEDNPDDMELTLRALQKSRITNPVVAVETGNDALDYLFGRSLYADRDPADTPAVVLLDLNLPGLGGLDVLRCLRNDDRTKMLPIVIFTTSRDRQDILNGYASGANSYVVKPVAFEHFTETIKQLGLYWLGLNEAPENSMTHQCDRCD